MERLDLTTQCGMGVLRTELEDFPEANGLELSVLGEVFEVTPMVIPINAQLDSVKRWLKDDIFFGLGSRQSPPQKPLL